MRVWDEQPGFELIAGLRRKSPARASLFRLANRAGRPKISRAGQRHCGQGVGPAHFGNDATDAGTTQGSANPERDIFSALERSSSRTHTP